MDKYINYNNLAGIETVTCDNINNVSAIEINYLSGVTAPIQTQLNAITNGSNIPVFSIGTTSTLSAGSIATVTITGSTANPILNLGIPTYLESRYSRCSRIYRELL
jgi:hypothetical protein